MIRKISRTMLVALATGSLTVDARARTASITPSKSPARRERSSATNGTTASSGAAPRAMSVTRLAASRSLRRIAWMASRRANIALRASLVLPSAAGDAERVGVFGAETEQRERRGERRRIERDRGARGLESRPRRLARRALRAAWRGTRRRRPRPTRARARGLRSWRAVRHRRGRRRARSRTAHRARSCRGAPDRRAHPWRGAWRPGPRRRGRRWRRARRPRLRSPRARSHARPW